MCHIIHEREFVNDFVPHPSIVLITYKISENPKSRLFPTFQVRYLYQNLWTCSQNYLDSNAFFNDLLKKSINGWNGFVKAFIIILPAVYNSSTVGEV